MLADRTIFHHYLHRLTLAQGGGRQLFLPKIYTEQMLDVQAASFVLGKPGFNSLAELIEKKESFICAEHDSRLAANNEVSERLKKIKRANQFILEEKGTHDLYVGWPFVTGLLNDQTPIRCPLLLWPVSLEVKQKKWQIALRDEEEITLNPAFLLSYFSSLNKNIDNTLLDVEFDLWEKDSTVFRTKLYQLLRDTMDIHFNPELFSDQLKNFETTTRQEFLQQHETGKLKLQPQAVLGIFPQAASQLVADYKHIIENTDYENLHQFFTALHHDNPSSTTEENQYTLLQSDSWQDEVLTTLKNGKSLVVQGPPGSGKSQMISNVIADALANGKRVLMVCQKRVALEVVYQRLAAFGLSNFISLVHDFRAGRNAVTEKIKNQIEDVEQYRVEDRQTSIIKSERQFISLSRRIQELVDFFEEHKIALLDESSYGISAKELYLTIDTTVPRVSLRQEYSFFDVAKLQALKRKAIRYIKFAEKFEYTNYAWKHRVPFVSGTLYEKDDRADAIQEVMIKKIAWQETLEPYQFSATLLELLQQTTEEKEKLKQFQQLLNDETTLRYFNHLLTQDAETISSLWLDNKKLNCLNCFEGESLEANLAVQDLGNVQQILQNRMEAERKSLIHLWFWQWFSKDKITLQRLLVQHQLKHTTEDLLRLEKKIDNRLNFEHHATALKQTAWLIDFPSVIEQKKIEHWFHQQKNAIRALELFHKLPVLRQFNYQTVSAIQKDLAVILHISDEYESNLSNWQQHVSNIQISRLFHQQKEGSILLETLERDFNDLVAFDQLKQDLSFAEKSVMDKVIESLPQLNEASAIQSIENSIQAEWLEHIERKYPILTHTTSDNFELLQQELQQAIQEKLQLSSILVKTKLRERVYQPIQFNRLNNAITYRDLHHQVSKKRMRWPLRKIVQQYKDEVFELIPCWLTTPEAASAIFAQEKQFDLVIFDEASQCFAEQAFPAMYRGKQILVTGDQKQLQPNDLYSIKEQHEIDHPDAEIESLLQIAERYLPSIMLKGHYRSKHEALLTFSNQHFYKNQLNMLADYTAQKRENPLHWIKVNGTWEKQSNLIEAEKIAELLFELHQQHPQKSIGVITFNIWQQELVWQKAEDYFLSRGANLPAHLFVKNIENVQGDERDIILFSVGYAPDKNGKMNHHFGSLSIDGGENRLNVAITRAREKIYVVSSIEPEELKVDQTLHIGPKLLRAYLQFVKNQMINSFTSQTENLKNGNSYLSSKIENEKLVGSPWPLVNLLVRDNQTYKGALLTDDDNLALHLSVRAFYAYLPTLLQHKNWKYQYINSRQYFMQPKEIETKINRLLN
ncbi:MAG: AAA domain-containing protein [Cyclobacteriaceae bacterium]|nr:AAA domain-containing protein [Cyclobacteriaceae bacterium]